MRRISLASLLVLAAAAAPLRAQDIGSDLSVLAGPNAQGYVGPLARGLGHALTAGLVSSADPHGMLGFSIGVRVMGAMFPEEDKTFLVTTPASVTYTPNAIIGQKAYTNPYGPSNTLSSATVAGEGAGVVLAPQGQFRTDLLLAGQNPNNFNIAFPKGVNLPLAPFGVIDAAVGIGFGTQIMARMIPTFNAGKAVGVDEVGDISAFGLGIMHNLTQWLPIPTPFWDVSVTAGTQKLSVGDYLEAKGNTIGLIASAGVGPLSVYAHGSSYKSDVDLDYTVKNPNNNPGLPANGTKVAFTQAIDRTQRVALGAQLNLLILKLSGEYGIGDYNTVSGRVAIGFE